MSTQETTPILPTGLPRPVPAPDGLDTPYWAATRRHELVAQRCRACMRWQWAPEFLCHRCHSFDLEYASGLGEARIFSWQRVWHPVHPGLAEACPYVVLLVEFPEADGIRMVGNLTGDPQSEIEIGARVVPVFEDHDDAEPPYTLVQWERA